MDTCENSERRLQSPVAIVDDDELVCRALRRLLSSRGIHAVTFTQGFEFVEHLDTEPWFQPACVVLDLHMPGLDGLALKKHLASRRPGVPVIFLTSDSEEQHWKRAIAAGALAVFSKPLYDDADTFIRTVEALVTT